MPWPNDAYAVSTSNHGRPFGRSTPAASPGSGTPVGSPKPNRRSVDVEARLPEARADLQRPDVGALREDLGRGEPLADVRVGDGLHVLRELERAALAVDLLGGLERPRGERRGDGERLHDRARLEAVGHGAVASRVGLRLAVVVRVVAGRGGDREDVARVRIDDDERRALRLVGLLREVELALRDVLDALVDREVDVVPLEGLLVRHPLGEDQVALPVAEARELLDVAAKLVVHRELDAVLPLPVRRHEAQDGTPASSRAG